MIEIDKESTASFDVDAQNTFTSKCPNELPVPDGVAIVKPLNDQAQMAAFRVGSKDAHCSSAIWIASKDKPQFSKLGEPDADIRWNSHAIVGTYGFELLDGLPSVKEYDYFVWKGIEPSMHPYGACYHDHANRMSTGVIEYFKMMGVKTVLLGGLALEFCVDLTAEQLAKAGFRVIINLSASRGIDAEGCAKSRAKLESLGVVFIKDVSELVLIGSSFSFN